MLMKQYADYRLKRLSTNLVDLSCLFQAKHRIIPVIKSKFREEMAEDQEI